MRKAKGKFTHLSQTARIQIEAWLKTKTPIKEIAAMLDVHISTIYREVKRGTYQKKVGYYDGYRYERLYKFKETYSPDIAEQKYRDNLAAKGAQRFQSCELYRKENRRRGIQSRRSTRRNPPQSYPVQNKYLHHHFIQLH